ncbi:hypothetical protein GCM10009706_20670 [Curtobacterium citreum]|uniref:ABC transporter transmembrane domain-containing protein n=1 Tax=Curtobacterium citreum TaxID=2036 RepID=A0ABT2HID7_9MICO|nr:ABC transporter transmembrane domain-containing protein [Curtobacterium citreum]MCS6523041.1 ABC transporter transmembrane domain-containing protein [Curtobacterium citreum]GGL81985.1 hypothetical protein GCM10009706_20670 [Curtobacterium citreum]
MRSSGIPDHGSRKRAPHVPQRLDSDCGVAALSSVMGCYGVRRSVGRMWQLYGRSQTAMSLLELQRVADRNGFDATCYRFDDLRQVSDRYLPAVLHLDRDGGHFVAIDRQRGDRVRVTDPAGDQGWVRKAALDTSGYLMTVVPSERPASAREDRSGGEVVRGLLWSARGRLSGVALLSLAATASGLAVSQFVRVLVDLAAAGALSSAALVAIGMITLLVAAAGATFGWFSTRKAFTSSVSMERELALGYGTTVLSLGGTAFRAYAPGDLMARFTDLSEMRSFVHDSVLSGILSAATLLGAVTVLGLQSPVAALACLVGVSAIASARWIKGKRIESLQRRAAGAESALTQAMVEVGEGSVTNRGAAWVAYQRPRLRAAFDGLIDQTRRVFLVSAALEFSTAFAGSVVLIVVMTLMAFQVQAGTLSLGSLASLAVLLPMMSGAAFALAGLQQDVQRATVSAERIEEISFARAALPVSGGAHAGDGAPLLRVEALRVVAAGSVLADLPRLSIQSGEVVGLRGPNGAGKSTICRVLAGLEDDWTGSIALDGEPLRDAGGEPVRYVPMPWP